MSCCFSKEPRVKTSDEIPKFERYDYLRPEGTIVYSIDRTYNIPMIQIIFDGCLKLVFASGQRTMQLGKIFFCWKGHHQFLQVILFSLIVELILHFNSIESNGTK